MNETENIIPEFVKVGNLIWTRQIGYCLVEKIENKFITVKSEDNRGFVIYNEEIFEVCLKPHLFKNRIFLGLPAHKNEFGDWIE